MNNSFEPKAIGEQTVNTLDSMIQWPALADNLSTSIYRTFQTSSHRQQYIMPMVVADTQNEHCYRI